MAKYIDAEKLKAEIERRRNSYLKAHGKYGRDADYIAATEDLRLLEFLDTLESEKPMQEGLENEAVNYCFDNGLNLSPRVATDFARHFAQWQKEQMMKEAVEGEVDFEYFGYKVIRPDLKQLDTLLESMNHGDKVRIIIVKENVE